LPPPNGHHQCFFRLGGDFKDCGVAGVLSGTIRDNEPSRPNIRMFGAIIADAAADAQSGCKYPTTD
jgi:hypothetical protein